MDYKDYYSNTKEQYIPEDVLKKSHNIPLIMFSVLIIIVIIFGGITFFIVKAPNYEDFYNERTRQGEFANPLQKYTENSSNENITLKNVKNANLSDEESILLQRDIVEYVLIGLKAYNLKSIPFKGETPKILFYIGDNPFGAEIVKGEIFVSKDLINKNDIIIKTSEEEAIKMALNKYYVLKSFEKGASKMELVAGKSTLFTKGYLDLYNTINGK